MTEPFIIDVHTHIGATAGFEAHWPGTDGFVRMMDLCAIELSVVISMGLLDAQFEAGYREAEEAIDRFPDRIRAYSVFDPNWPDESLALVERYLDHPGFVGIKIHPTIHAVDPQDSRYAAFWAFADQHRQVVLTHSWSPDPAKPTQNLAVPDRFDPILRRHPRLRLILGHCGGRIEGVQQAVALMQRHPHCYADLSGDTWPLGQLEWLMSQVPPDRILLGTDSNWIEPRYVIAHALRANLPDDLRLAVLRTNALTLFQPHLAPPQTTLRRTD